MSEFRKHGDDQLLIYFVSPFRPVTSATIARWVRFCMFEAGVDLKEFGMHSVRGAMASKVFLSGGRLEEFLRAADWSSADVFAKFYLKPLGHVSSVVLSQL